MMKSQRLILIALFLLVAVPSSVVLAGWSVEIGDRLHFWSTPGEIAESAFVPHNDGLNSLGRSILVEYGINSVCWFAILYTIFIIFRNYQKLIAFSLITSYAFIFLLGQYDTFKREKQLLEFAHVRPPEAKRLSTENVRPPDKVLILQTIAGYSPKCPDGVSAWFRYEDTPSYRHSISYGSASNDDCAGIQPVTVALRQFANADWAQYAGRIDPATKESDGVEKCTKFENTIFVSTKTLTNRGYIEFFWVSGDYIVFMKFERGAQDATLQGDFLKTYLEKYPSSL